MLDFAVLMFMELLMVVVVVVVMMVVVVGRVRL
jgi:hypothetical protein